MKEFLIVYFKSPNKVANGIVTAYSKKGAMEIFEVQEKGAVILNIIEL